MPSLLIAQPGRLLFFWLALGVFEAILCLGAAGLFRIASSFLAVHHRPPTWHRSHLPIFAGLPCCAVTAWVGAFGHMPRLSPEVCSAGPGAPAPTPAILPCSHHRAGLSADRPWPWSMQTGSWNFHRPCWQKARQGRARQAQRQGMGGLERSGLAAVGDRACPCSVMGQVPPGRVSSCAWRASAGGVCRRQVAPCRMPSE